MLLLTINNVPGKNIEALGLVEGTTVESANIGKDLGATLKNIVGGELKSYTEMIVKARSVAKERMIENAKKMGADAILGLRYGSSNISTAASEIIVYGTAVKFV